MFYINFFRVSETGKVGKIVQTYPLCVWYCAEAIAEMEVKKFKTNNVEIISYAIVK